MSNKILVTGATGNIGNFLVQRLKEKGADFIAGVQASEMRKFYNSGEKVVELDFSDDKSLDKAMKGVDTLFMLLPLGERMSEWGRNLVYAAKRNRIKFVLRSSLIDSNPESKHFIFKVHGQIDHILRESGIPFCIVHPNAFMQNFVAYMADEINSTGTFSFAHGNARISYNDVRDIAAVDAEILTNPEAHRAREYIVTGPRAITDSEIALLLSKAASRDISYAPISEEKYIKELHDKKISEWQTKAFVSLEHNVMEDKQSVLSGIVRKITGKNPITFDQFAMDYASTWKKVKVGAGAR
jgi:uncharacterized protein YbjT (DUF2867 family)